MTDALRDALEQVDLACQHAIDVMKADCPIGAEITWRSGGRLHSGVVTRHGFGLHVVALRTRTGKPARVSAHDIVQAVPQKGTTDG